MNFRDERGEVHPYVLAAGIIVVLMTAFLTLSEAVMVNAATYYATQAVEASLRGAARMQDFRAEGRLLPDLPAQRFATLLASNLNLQVSDQEGNTIKLQPNGAHPYIAGTTTADFWVVPTTRLDAAIARVEIPLRLPFIGPYYRQLYHQPPTICLSLAVTPHDLFGGEDLDPAAIGAAYQCP